MKKYRFILLVAVALVGLTPGLPWGTVGEAGGSKTKSEKFTVKVIGPLVDPPSSFCPVGPNLFGFSGDVFKEDDDPQVDDPIGTYDACVQSFTGNPFAGGGKAELKARFILADGTISVTCTCYPTISAKPPEVDGNVLLSFTSGVGSITDADGISSGATSASTIIGNGESELAPDPTSPIGLKPVRERAFFFINLQLDD
ncbi:MAG: hypothetical protein QGI09_11575 [Dehalococcoidia bacterium]|nr:hypothetical protein [Dehalococcoidia bacterium]